MYIIVPLYLSNNNKLKVKVYYHILNFLIYTILDINREGGL